MTFGKMLLYGLGVAAVGFLIYWVIFFTVNVSTEDLGCTNPEESGTLSTCTTTTGRPRATVNPSTTIRPTTTAAPQSTTTTTVPRSAPLTATRMPPPPFTFTGAPSTTTTSRTTSRTTTTQPVPSPVQALPDKLGTLDTYGTEAKCGGIPISVGQTLTNNGVVFSLNAVGTNGSPELTINGRGSYTYAEIRIVTGGDPFVGHATGVSVPAGEIHRAYDISTPGKTLKGVLVCL